MHIAETLAIMEESENPTTFKMIVNKELLRNWGENTAYSAKGHYKTADIKSMYLKILIIVNVVFAIFSLLDFPYSFFTTLFGISSLIASILLLVEEASNGQASTSSHMMLGDEYLNVHYKLQELNSQENPSMDNFNKLASIIEELNTKQKPRIFQIAKKQAKTAIEIDGEMTKWWKL